MVEPRRLVIMIFLSFLIACIASVGAQVRPIGSRLDKTAGSEWKINRPSYTPLKGAVIENKNVNIIVNVDPKDVAKELWKLIQSRLDDREGRRSGDNRRIVDELERIVTPVVRPTRRSHTPSAFEVAYALDHLTRKALFGDHLSRPTIDDEIVTRDVVARMMVKLKTITKDEENHDGKLYRTLGTRRMQESEEYGRENDDDNDDEDDENDEDDEDDDQYVRLNLKIRKSELLKATRHSSVEDS